MNDKPALRPNVSVGRALRAVARDIVEEGRAPIDDPDRPDAVAVHDFRKAMKRWRAQLRLLEPFLGAEGVRLRHEARDLARALAGARDAQAALNALNDLVEHDATLQASSVTSIRRKLEELRQGAESNVLSGTMRGTLRAALSTAELGIEAWPVDDITFAQLAERLADGYRRARAAIPQVWPQTDDETLHELRRRVVVHRYQMEVVEPLWPRMSKLWVGEAQRLRDRLGARQDLAVLEGLIGPHQPLARWRSRLAPPIAARAAAHVEGASRLAGRLFAETPKAFRRRLEALWANRGGN